MPVSVHPFTGLELNSFTSAAHGLCIRYKRGYVRRLRINKTGNWLQAWVHHQYWEFSAAGSWLA